MKEHGKRGIVLAGRPYHVDPEIHHGIPDLIELMGGKDVLCDKLNYAFE